MRNNPTTAETKMYNILYSSVVPRFPDHKFYRQSVKFGYILDFYCPTLHLGIEVDGGVHDEQVGVMIPIEIMSLPRMAFIFFVLVITMYSIILKL